MAEKKARKPRQKRVKEILSNQVIGESVELLANTVQESLEYRDVAFAESTRSVDSLAEYFANSGKETKNRILPLEKKALCHLPTQVN